MARRTFDVGIIFSGRADHGFYLRVCVTDSAADVAGRRFGADAIAL